MVYSHWPEPRPEQGRITSGLYEAVCKVSSHLNQDGARPVVPIVLVPVPVPVSVLVQLSKSVIDVGYSGSLVNDE